MGAQQLASHSKGSKGQVAAIPGIARHKKVIAGNWTSRECHPVFRDHLSPTRRREGDVLFISYRLINKL